MKTLSLSPTLIKRQNSHLNFLFQNLSSIVSYNKPDKVFENIIASSSSVMNDLQFAIPRKKIQSLHFYKDYVHLQQRLY